MEIVVELAVLSDMESSASPDFVNRFKVNVLVATRLSCSEL